MNLEIAAFIPWFPAVAAVLCGLCCIRPSLSRLAGPLCVVSIAVGFAVTLGVWGQIPTDGGFTVVPFFDWIVAGKLSVGFGYFFDPLTLIMMNVVYGIGTLIAVYALGYMKHDDGYARFFAAVSLFIFAMATLVMADNLILLYLGWEGVGLCSYLLIGHYAKYPVAVKAAKKAFIVNRIGDLGFALGIFLVYMIFGSVRYEAIIPAAQAVLADHPDLSLLSAQALSAYQQADSAPVAWLWWAPFLLMIGAFGKSAQLPLFVWLPDAMAGPTPVSALIHAATMVTAGVFMVARLTPIFLLSPYALPTITVVGAVTCFFAATIALTSNDLKGVFAYSTVSQIGYMFIGVGVESAGGVFHLTTHAFFKALLFLTAGSVMHALGGNLDIRTMSGLRHKMPVTCVLMLAGCLALAAFPFTSGFYSKDMLLGDALLKGLATGQWWYYLAVILGLTTAALTAYYTFRLWFKVFMGPEQFSMGDSGHTPDNELEKCMIAVAKEEAQRTGHPAHGPHEMPWAMNVPLVVLAAGALLWGIVGHGWIVEMLANSTQSHTPFHGADTHGDHHPAIIGMDPHLFTTLISVAVGLGGIAVAGYFYWLRRDLVPAITRRLRPIYALLHGKYYIDELYDATIVRPLYLTAQLCFVIDQFLIDGLVQFFGWLPGRVGRTLQPLQSGRLQGYGVGMAAGMAVIVVLIFWVISYP